MRPARYKSITIPGPGRRPPLRRGLTLVELLVVILISVVVIAVAFTLYRVTATYYVREDAHIEQMQNLRVALYSIARDVRMAGNSSFVLGADVRTVNAYVPGMEVIQDGQAVRKAGENWFSHADTDELGARPIFGVDGGQNGPDTLTIFRTSTESGAPVGYLAQPYSNANRIVLQENFVEGTLEPGDIIALVNNGRAVILEVADADFTNTTINIQSPGRFTSGDVPTGAAGSFVAGSAVYNLRDVTLVTYYLDTENNNLMADYHDSAVGVADGQAGTAIVATNIEDFQVFYYFPTETVETSPPATLPNNHQVTSAKLDNVLAVGPKVLAVNLALVARSPYGDGQGNRYGRPALFNRLAAPEAENDNHPRSILTETIYLRNNFAN